MTFSTGWNKLLREYNKLAYSFVYGLLWPAAAGNLIWLLIESTFNFYSKDNDTNNLIHIAILCILSMYTVIGFLRSEKKKKFLTWKETLFSYAHIILIITVAHTAKENITFTIFPLILFYIFNFFNHLIYTPKNLDMKLAGANMFGLFVLLISFCADCEIRGWFVPASLIFALVIWSCFRIKALGSDEQQASIPCKCKCECKK